MFFPMLQQIFAKIHSLNFVVFFNVKFSSLKEHKKVGACSVFH